MSRVFRWCMRHGAAILFAFAILQLLVGLIPLLRSLVSETGRMAANYGYVSGESDSPVWLEIQMLWASISAALFPFFAALVIDRADRWLAARSLEAAQ